MLTGEDTQIGTNTFNPDSHDVAYAGFYYNLSNEYATENNGTQSDAGQTLDNWYSSNLSSYSSYIDQSGKFCNDRTISGTLGGFPGTTGYGTTDTYLMLEEDLLFLLVQLILLIELLHHVQMPMICL